MGERILDMKIIETEGSTELTEVVNKGTQQAFSEKINLLTLFILLGIRKTDQLFILLLGSLENFDKNPYPRGI